ncbi:MAG TPA: hypothetical protein VN282_09635 [Pyrinomonadaceae bacterium]|nr:hypothetical protein [Pyrinomonadaceae bacterium]
MKDPVYREQSQPARADDPSAVARGPRDPGTVIPMRDRRNPALSAAGAGDTFTFSCAVGDSGEAPDEPGQPPDTEVGTGGDEVGPRDEGTVIP